MTTSHPVFELADRYVDAFAAARPLEATFAGVEGHDDRWGDLGPDGVAAVHELLRSTRRELDALPPADDRWARLAVRVLGDELDLLLDRYDHDDPLRDVGHLASTVPELLEVLELLDAETDEGRSAIVARLATFPDALDGWRRTVDAGRRRGIVAARRQARSVADQLRAMAGDDGGLAEVAAAVAAADPARSDEVAATLDGARAAADETAAWIDEVYVPAADEADGVGRERYLRAARGHLGTDIDPEETYAWGWRRIDELTVRAGDVARRVAASDPEVFADVDPDDLLAVVRTLRTDPAFAAATPEDFRELMQARLATALDALDGTHFTVPDQIRRVEVHLASGGALGARYVGPSEDFSRPGTVWWSLDGDGPVPLWEEVSTAYHEGFPGHHLQVGIQVGLADRLSRAHRTLIWGPGYGEGWALYTEQLMDELGHLEHPAYELGYLAGELLRAARVVVDIGMHLDLRIPDHAPRHAGERWSFDRAVDVLERIALLAPAYAQSEVARYLGWPGQAISYAIGQRVIVALREERRARDGDAFDLAAFHADVLGSGPVGLDLLRDVVLGEA